MVKLLEFIIPAPAAVPFFRRQKRHLRVLQNQIPIGYDDDENFEYDDESGINYDAYDDDNDQNLQPP